MSRQGIILKILSGFYYVLDEEQVVTCKARGKFRHQKLTPLVGDHVLFSVLPDGSGILEEILPRKNEFHRPALANIDQLIIIASGALPVTDPFLIDWMISLAEERHCEPIVCINKWDLVQAGQLYDIYSGAGFRVIPTSAKTGEGIQELSQCLTGKVSAFTGNSGIGKSSILNMLAPEMDLAVGQVSQKLGRGRHTTRHVELYQLPMGAVVADTPGFSSFEESGEPRRKEEVQHTFREFAPYLDRCRFTGCAHLREKGCAVLDALARGEIHPSRHASYVRLYEQAEKIKSWELK